MITLLKKIRMRLLPKYVLLAILTASISMASCSKEDELEIQTDFPFEAKVMPVPKDISNGQTVDYDDPPYQPNDLYSLPTEQFRLYYTSTSAVSQSFEVWILDSFGNEKQLSFQFNSSD